VNSIINIYKLVHFLLGIILISITFSRAYSQIINYKTEITIDDHKNKITKRTFLIQINDKDENLLSHVIIQHSPKQDFTFNYARLFDKNGNKVKSLKKKDLTTRNDISYQAYYQDDLITEFDLYWSEFPYRIEYSYSIVENEYLHLTHWSPVWYHNVASIEASLEVTVPLDYKYKVHATEGLEYSDSRATTHRVMSWRSGKVKSSTIETYSPPRDGLIPQVILIPDEFKYGIDGRLSTWSTFGSWYEKLNTGTEVLPQSEAEDVKKLVKGISDKSDIVRRIYYYLQDHTKYINVAIDVGGLKSYPASYVAENKYGDCKALTTYMKAMLQSVGISSYYSVINAGHNASEVITSMPSSQFNHVILMVPLTNDTIWLENTSNYLPFNYLGTFTQNRNALVVNGMTSRLIKTPRLSYKDVTRERNYNLSINNKSADSIYLELIIKGKEFERFKSSLYDKDKKRQKSIIEELLAIGDSHIDHWHIKDNHRNNTYLHIDIKGTTSSLVRKIGSLQTINPLRIQIPDFEIPKKRKLDVLIRYPISKLDKTVISIDNLHDKEIQFPEAINIDSEFGIYQAEYTESDNKLLVTEKFILAAGKIPLKQYEEFYKFFTEIINHKKTSAIIIK